MKQKNIVKWLQPEVLRNDYQYYKQWCTEAWQASGGIVVPNNRLSFETKKKLSVFNPINLILPSGLKGSPLIVCCGAFPSYSAWPFLFRHEIIPIIWDCWPRYHKRMLQSLKYCNVKTVFCTSSQVANLINSHSSKTKAFWLPEGIKVEAYKNGPKLEDREIDILELGRIYSQVHSALTRTDVVENSKLLFSDGNTLLFKSFADLKNGIANSKICINFPRCMTHPEMAGDIETLTQRYWECMLSGTLMVGKTPKELVDVCGYNPVVELEIENKTSIEIAMQIRNILDNIESYQPLCDKNRDYALHNASWTKRIELIRNVLATQGYFI